MPHLEAVNPPRFAMTRGRLETPIAVRAIRSLPKPSPIRSAGS